MDSSNPPHRINNDLLWAQTALLAQREHKISLALLLHLREIESRRLHLDRGYPSMYEYVVRELHFAEGPAFHRVQAMQLLKDVPEAGEEIASGRLSITTAAKVQNAYRKLPVAEKKEALASLAGKSSREVDRTLTAKSGHARREFTRWISAEEMLLTVFLNRATFEQLTEIQNLRSHAVEKPSYGTTVKDLVELGQEKWNPLRRKAPSAPVKLCTNSHGPSKRSRSIPAAVRIAVWQRDGARCSYVDPQSGLRCETRRYLQLDHIEPVALGGTTTVGNLRLLCGQHNRRRAEKTYGPRPSPAACEGKE